MGWFLHDLIGVFNPLDWFNHNYWEGPSSNKVALQKAVTQRVGKSLYSNPSRLAKLAGEINNYNYKVNNDLTRIGNLKDNWLGLVQAEEQNMDPNVYTSNTAALYSQYKHGYNKLLNAAVSAYHGDLSKLNKLMTDQSFDTHAMNTYENNRNERSSTGDSLIGAGAGLGMLLL